MLLRMKWEQYCLTASQRPIGYASSTLLAAEKKYSQTEKEGLACIFGVKQFHSFLFGHQFFLYTDQESLLGHPVR